MKASVDFDLADRDAASAGQGPEIAEVGRKLAFLKKLQAVTNRIHSASNMDEIIGQLSDDICHMFEADRLTIYTMADDGSAIVSKVKTGLQSFKDIKLPVNNTSIAGFAAYNRQLINIADVYDDAELKRYAPPLAFLKAVDKRTGYRTKQMLAVPILAAEGQGELIGVLQLINHHPGEKFPLLAEEGAVELAKTLAIALSTRHNVIPGATKYDHLVTSNIISSGELELASRTARRKNKTVEDILIDEFQVSFAALGECLSLFHGVPYKAYSSNFIKPHDLFRNLKREYVDSNQWLPLEDGPDGRVILTTDPERLRSSRVVENVYSRVKLVYNVTTQREFGRTLDLFFGETQSGSSGNASIGELLSNMEEEDGVSVAEEASAAADNELVKLVNRIIEDAHRQGASDIHIEPYPGKQKTIVRFRKDGTLVPYIEVPASYRNALVTRIKIMCDLDISEKRKPQDGKIKFKKFGPIDIELRVATLPSTGGVEDVVMRLLSQGAPIPMNQLALSRRNFEVMQSLITKPYGLFFVCGPTGSGKTTTLHSALGHINTPETKIWTAEDPVEITQRGLRQIQVNPKAGLTFATAMRAFLRADPDVIMVGEMRDKETVSMGVEASLTGHLVFSTLHTNSAPESIVRLLDMGMDPFNFADALIGILAQRLAKRLCVKCKRPHKATRDDLDLLMHEYAEELRNTTAWQRNPEAELAAVHDDWVKQFGNDKGEITFYSAEGCDACDNTGYRGRVGLHELLVGSEGIKRLIHEHARVSQIFATAIEEGMRTLKQDGIEKVLQGITDINQVRAVCSR